MLIEVVQRVPMLGENDQFATMPVGIEHLGLFCSSLESSSHFLSVPECRTL